MPIRGLGLLYTLKCNIVCRHCGIYSSPKLEDKMTVSEATGYIDEAAGLDHCQLIIFTGGEALLYFDEIVQLIERCAEHDLVSRVVTNGFWALDYDKGVEKARRLKEAGLTQLSISADEYHQEFLRPRVVGNSLRAAREAGLIRSLEVRYGVDSPEVGEFLEGCGVPLDEVIDVAELGAYDFNNPTRPSVGRDQMDRYLDKIILNRAAIVPLGRGQEYAHECPTSPLSAMPDAPCGFTREYPVIYPNGGLLSCCTPAGFFERFLQGMAGEVSLRDLEHRMDNDPVLQFIAVQGPEKLTRLAREAGHELPESYAGTCHACVNTLSDVPPEEIRRLVEGRFLETYLFDMKNWGAPSDVRLSTPG